MTFEDSIHKVTLSGSEISTILFILEGYNSLDSNDFKSCPQNVDGTGDFDCADYVSEWSDWEGVDYETLFNIHQACVINKNNHANSLTLEGV